MDLKAVGQRIKSAREACQKLYLVFSGIAV